MADHRWAPSRDLYHQYCSDCKIMRSLDHEDMPCSVRESMEKKQKGRELTSEEAAQSVEKGAQFNTAIDERIAAAHIGSPLTPVEREALAIAAGETIDRLAKCMYALSELCDTAATGLEGCKLSIDRLGDSLINLSDHVAEILRPKGAKP